MIKTFNIGEITKELGINKETVRYYEKLGLLCKPMKGSNGYRMYTQEDMRKIRFIRVAKAYGFSLKEISLLFPKIYEDIYCENKESMLALLDNKLIEIDQKINELVECKALISKLYGNIITNDNTLCDGINIYNHSI